LSEYIEKYLEKATPVLEKERNSKADDQLKIKVIAKYNSLLEKFSN